MGPAVSVVVPAYNEAARLATSLPRLLDLTATDGIEVLVVDDGSTDDTVAVAEAHLKGTRTGRVLSLPRNRGKGAAVRAGVLEAAGAAVVYMDADLAADLDDLGSLLEALSGADIAVGSRAVPGSRVFDSTFPRAVMGRSWNAMVRLVTGLELHDSQCGFKGFQAPVARTLFQRSRIDGFAFDVEILALAQREGMKIVEVPVTWRAVGGSSVRPVLDSMLMARDLARIRLRRTGIRSETEPTPSGATPIRPLTPVKDERAGGPGCPLEAIPMRADPSSDR
jgi:glycosyltransferase involved in cell wall biosynthesis